MCGIAGILAAGNGEPARRLQEIASLMGLRQSRRGPDSRGLWSEPGVAFAHERLAIQDLSAEGHQPMHSACGRLVLVYNGEVYNVGELRRELEALGAVFRGHSDTEVLLDGFIRWGIEATLDRLVGMFAFALWDREARELTLGRDRFGIKPLFWYADADRFLFGSEIKAVLAAMDRAPDIERQALAGYLETGYVPAPWTIYKGICKLRPGWLLRVRPGAEPRQSQFWSLDDMLRRALSRPRISDPREARDLIEARLGEAVRMRLLSDRPVGALLSGGIDSTMVAALMQDAGGPPVRTYSIGSADPRYDEAGHARLIARHLGTDHTELTVTEQDCLAVIPDLTGTYDEPFGDSSQVPALAISRLASRHVTVALSGDGGDEVFCGYNRYRWNARLAGLRRRLPGGLRRMIAAGLGGVPPRLFALAERATGEAGMARRIHKLGAMLAENDAGARYRAVLAQWPDLASCLSGAEPAAPVPWEAMAGMSEEESFQVLDLLTYLPDDILTKVDRASMAFGLEVRVPFLDHRVVEAAFMLDPALKLRGGKTKWILRQMLADRVPAHLFERPKQGFAIPIEKWLRVDLADWGAALVNDTDWEGRFGLPTRPIRDAWDQHRRGAADNSDRLWSILMLASWAAGATAAAASADPAAA
ncbi:MAG TPA: asparagine synthase (glutamine-hydrolyzing) [Thermohalobaculum sp.]|nr:asparagine synthase (glutamine-hydrolyzing) [Thermohalobaculum sp.]